MLCPVCEEEFRAEGTTSLGTWDVANMTDEEIDEAAKAIDAWFMEQVTSYSSPSSERSSLSAKDPEVLLTALPKSTSPFLRSTSHGPEPSGRSGSSG